MEKRYLGDSVYVEIDRAGDLVLTTENDEGPPSNSITLEPEVYAALIAYISAQERHVLRGEEEGKDA